MFIQKLFIKIFAILLIMIGLMDILVGWGYLVLSASADAGQQVLKNSQKSYISPDHSTPPNHTLIQTIHTFNYYQTILAIMSLFFLLLGPVFLYIGHAVFRNTIPYPYFTLALGILQIFAEYLSYYFFTTWQFPKTITILLCLILIFLTIAKRKHSTDSVV